MDHRRINAANDGNQGVVLKAESGDSGEIDRRRFVKTAGGILIAAGGVVGCTGTDGDGGTDPAPTGTLALSVAGLNSSAADGGTVTVTAANGSGSVTTVPTSGTLQQTLPVGDYSVLYAPPAGFTLSAGTTNVQTAAVQADQVTTVQFQVVQATGTIQITVSGLDASATSGGSVVVTRTDITGQAPVTVNIPVSASVDTSVLPGTYDVSYTPPGGHIVASGVTNPQTVFVTASTTTPVAFQVQLSTGAAPDIGSHDFEDGTAGVFTDGAGGSPLDPGKGWVLESAAPAARGTNSMRQDYPQSAGNIGESFFFSLSPNLTALYIRFAYKQDTNWPNNDDMKVQRMQATINGQFGSFLINGGGSAFWYFWDSFDGTVVFNPNTNLPAPVANDFRGEWHWYEIFRDISVSGALVFRVWIDDVLYFDYTHPVSNQGVQFRQAQFDGTVNSLSNASSAWFDEVGISSQKMGIP